VDFAEHRAVQVGGHLFSPRSTSSSGFNIGDRRAHVNT
jgi:hypothetical protein